MTTAEHDFHITIGSTGMNLGRDVLLVKLALLYGDRLTLCSPMTSLLLKDLALPAVGIIDRLNFLQGITDNPVIIKNIKIFKYLLQKKNLTPPERAARQKLSLEWINQEFEKRFEDVKRQQKINSLGLEGIEDAVSQGKLNLEMIPFSRDFDAMMADFVQRLSGAIQKDKSYPLFDDATGKIVRSALKKGSVNVGSDHQRRHINLAACLLEKLPSFDSATISDVLGIREELANPLERFRSAIGGFSREIENAPWDADFQKDVEVVFQEKVKPAVSEIEEEVKTSRFTKLFGKNLVANAWMPAVAPLTTIVTRQGDLAELAILTLATTAAAAVGSLGKAGVDTYKEIMARLEKVKKNQMYFYYQTRERLSKTAGKK